MQSRDGLILCRPKTQTYFSLEMEIFVDVRDPCYRAKYHSVSLEALASFDKDASISVRGSTSPGVRFL